jgi:hypothetical protein
MSFHTRFLFLISCFTAFYGFSQKCRIDYSYSTSEQLVRNKVKEVKIKQGADTSIKLLHHFFIGEKGCPEKQLYYDFYSKGVEPTVYLFSSDPNKTKIIYTHGRLIGGKVREYEKTEEYYTRTGKITDRKRTESIDFVNIILNKYDIFDDKKIDMWMYCMMLVGDTISSVISFFNGEKRMYTLLTKKAEGWEETEKLITLYKNGELQEQKQFSKGILIKTTTKEMLNEQQMKEINNEPYLANNPLPFNNTPIIDTTYSESDQIILNQRNGKNKKAKFRILRYNDPMNPAKTDHADVILQKNGLLQKRISFNPTQNLYFEYLFR